MVMITIYVLFVLSLVTGEEHEWKTYASFEECWETATLVVKSKPNLVARCVAKDIEQNK
jgi:hypothetical protein